MKKLLAILLALVLVLSTGALAFAETDGPGNPFGDENDADWTEVIFKKSITTTNEETTHPAETFDFTITPVSAVDEQDVAIEPIPAFSPNTFSITVEEGAGSATLAVDLPDLTNIGTYVYKVVETAKTTAGMTYDTTEYELTIVVVNDFGNESVGLKRLVKIKQNGNKTDTFNNSYDAGKLVVSKYITGNNADFTEKFPVKVTLTPEAITEGGFKPITSTISVTGAIGTATHPTVIGTANAAGVIEVSFWVTDNSKVTINNIPYDVTYVVEETDTKNYVATYTGASGTITALEGQSTEIVNTKTIDVPTGIFLENLPYIILLSIAGVGLLAFVVSKRRRVNQ